MNLSKSFHFNEYLSVIKLYSLERISIYSDNDPYVQQYESEKFDDNISSKKVLINGAGHFNERYDYIEFTELLKHL